MRTILFGIMGVILGIPVSYFFQASALRGKLSLGKYLQHLPDLVENMDRHSGVVSTLVVTMVMLGIAGVILGALTDPNRRRA